MKKFGLLIISLIMAVAFTFGVNLASGVVSAEEPVAPNEIHDITGLEAISGSTNCILTDDINGDDATTDVIEQADFESINLFSGVIDGQGYSIKNLKIKANSENVGIFSSLFNATIKNINFENITIVNDDAVSVSSIGSIGIIAGTMENSQISNCSITNSSIGEYITVEEQNTISYLKTNSTIFAGGIAGNIYSGSKVLNTKSNVNIFVKQQGIDVSKQLKLGGVVGQLSNALVVNCINENILSANPVQDENAWVGGLIGVVSGNKSIIKNCVTVCEFTQMADYDGNLASIIGRIDAPNDMPESGAISNLYCQELSYNCVGNATELNSLAPTFTYSCNNTITSETLISKLFWTTATNWDDMYEWNMNNIWQIENIDELPKLQMFETFSWSFSEDNSFISVTKPQVSGTIIEIDASTSYRYDYNGQIVIKVKLTNIDNIDKFFEITGLRKGDNANIIYNNNNINEQSEDVVYTAPDTDGFHTYTISNCDLTDQGVYSVVLSTIKYNFKVQAEDAESPDKGKVRRSSADANSTLNQILETISYGQTLSYVASPGGDYAFNGWFLELPTETSVEPMESRITFSTIFNEKLFLENGLFASIVTNLDDYKYDEEAEEQENYLSIYATFTQNIYNIVFKIEVNSEVVENITKIYVDNKEVKPNEDTGVVSIKLKKGSSHAIRIIEVADYDFTGWYVTRTVGSSDKDLPEAAEQTLIFNSDNGFPSDGSDVYIVATFTQEIEDDNADLTWLWIALSIIGGIGLIIIIIVIIIKKRGDTSYKNMYY